ncbi:tannase/feruloyl esterase family alpha/beta hydrolase [Solimonas sp. K1W22B-7]|uniref:tannase/feruloyl esterase family alpha/beta hydrolase n=1 Tax=Solimonas sp. K1W22B-7 TaxID=2303331 RepID=UPI000E337A96|nr:tannase/feruloyl esterase family alpha/beta hydrolase [Solimonas sp. K1W22B-7]AXQ29393.1 tannase/feruloyl esterase family alpha/beta hydrolase [Solimonas sp. K1W22B-7]
MILRFAGTLLVLCALAACAPSATPLGPSARCEALSRVELPGVQVKSASIPKPEKGQPEYCRVKGVVDRARFELRLPTERWNGKYYMAGCGTFCGVVGTGDPQYKLGIERGYATIISDAGHQSWTSGGSSWARDDPEARSDHAWRAVHRTAGSGRKLTETYYGAGVQRAYFNGCSNGGRQGLMQATRFPEDFDGILAESPAQDVLPILMVWTHALLDDTGADGKPIFRREKLPLLQRAVAKACGDRDGVVTGMECDFDPVALQCPQGERDDCLSADEVRVVRAWYAGPPASDAYEGLGGVPKGSEAFWLPRSPPPLLTRMLTRVLYGASLDDVLVSIKLGSGILIRDVLSTPALDPDYDARDFDPARDLPRLQPFAAEMTPSRDLSGLRARGGKLLITQSLGDIAVPPAYNVAYWQEAQARLGENAADTVRMFLIPGMGHCGNGEGPQLPGYDSGDFDALSALENWVEKGQAPAALIATRRDTSGRVTRSEPLCALPARAVYLGQGDPADYASWACR